MKHFPISFSYYSLSPDELTETDRLLYETAVKACHTAYAPYSRFHVGAAIRLANDLILCGSNQENVAFPSGICAERCALFYANAQYPDTPVDCIAVAACDAQGILTDFPVTPCGACRQVMLESERRQSSPISLLLCGKSKTYLVDSCQDLLPLQFEM